MLSTSVFGHVPWHLLFSGLVLHSGYCFCAGHYHSTHPVPHLYSSPAHPGSLYSGGNVSTLSFASVAFLSTMSAQLWPLLTRFKFFNFNCISNFPSLTRPSLHIILTSSSLAASLWNRFKDHDFSCWKLLKASFSNYWKQITFKSILHAEISKWYFFLLCCTIKLFLIERKLT